MSSEEQQGETVQRHYMKLCIGKIIMFSAAIHVVDLKNVLFSVINTCKDYTFFITETVYIVHHSGYIRKKRTIQ